MLQDASRPSMSSKIQSELSNVDDSFLHLKHIIAEFSGARPSSKLELKLKHETAFKQKSTVYRKEQTMTWDCDMYIKGSTKTVLSVQKPGVKTWHKVLADFPLVLNPVECKDDSTVERKNETSGVNVKLSLGKSKPDAEVTRLLAKKAVMALASKVSILERLDKVVGHLDGVLELGNTAAQLHPAAQFTFPIVSAAFKKFQDIPACHREFIGMMDDVVDMLPVVNLATERVTDNEAKILLDVFYNTIRKLSEDLIKYSSVSTSDFLFRNWYESKKEDIKKTKDRILNSKLNLQVALSVDLIGKVTDIQKELNQIRQYQASDTGEKIFERIKPPEFSAYDPTRCCLPGTRSFVLQDLEEWSTSVDHSSRVFWLYGVAGCGKSAIATSLASALDSKKILTGSYFCKRDIPERRNAIRLIRSLAYYLGRAIAPLGESLIRALKEDPVILDKPLFSQFKGLLSDRIIEIGQSAPKAPIIFILDALDECNDSKYVASLLLQVATLAPWLRLVVTSRPFQEIEDELEPARELTNPLDLFSLSADDDIRVYVRTQLAPKGLLVALRNHITDEQVEILVRKASGLFIWITTVCAYIGLRRFGKLGILKQILESEAAPDSEKQLDILYLQVLESVASVGEIAANKDAVRLLVGLVYTTSKNRTLPSSALHAFIPSDLGVLLEELEMLLLDLGSVLSPDVRTKAIRACHPSFLDFLGNPDRSGSFWIEPTKLDTMMTEKCFAIMMAGLKFNICELEFSYLPNSDVKELKGRIDQRISRELQYSCLYWINHLSGCKIAYSPQEAIWKMPHSLLCHTMSMYWIEELSLLSELREAGPILQRFMGVIKDSSDAKELYNYAADLYRFVKAFHEPISISTPHLYISALLWAPSESIIAKSMGQQFISPRCVIEGRNNHWPATLQILASPSEVCCVAYSPDGRHIVSGSSDNTVRIWDAETSILVGDPFHGHTASVRAVSYSPDGRQIASGSDDMTVRLWDAESGASVGEPLRGHEERVVALAYSPDGRRVVSVCHECIRIWDVKTLTQVGDEFYKGGMATCVAYSPDIRYVVSGSVDGSVRVWDTQSSPIIDASLWGHDDTVTSVACSPDGHYVVSASSDTTIRIWDTLNGDEVGEPLQGHTAVVDSVAYSPNGRYIVSGSSDSTIRVWDAETGAMAGDPLRGHNGMVNSVAYSPDGRLVVSGSTDETIRIWDVDAGAEASELLPGHSASVECAMYSPDGSQIVSASSDKTIRIWDAQTFESIGEAIEGHTRNVYGVAYSPDGNHIASGSSDETLRIWDVRTREQIGESIRIPNTVSTVNTGVLSVVYSPNGRDVAFGARDRTGRIYNTEKGALFDKPLRHDDWVKSIAYSPDGKHVVTGSDDGTLRIWDAETGAPVSEPLIGHVGRVRSVAYSPDGRRIVSGSKDATLRIWDAQTCKLVGEPLQGHTKMVQAVAFSPDGRYIVSGSDDETLRIWDAQRGSQIGEPLRGHNGFVFTVAYSPDGKYIISGATDFTLRVWDAHTSANANPLSAVYSKLPSSIPVDGWIRTSDDGLLLWVPPEYRDGMFDVSLARMPRNAPGHPVRIDWDRLPQGSTWSRVKEEQTEGFTHEHE